MPKEQNDQGKKKRKKQSKNGKKKEGIFFLPDERSVFSPLKSLINREEHINKKNYKRVKKF